MASYFNSSADRRKETELHRASKKGSLQKVQSLIEQEGANMNEMTIDGKTPLILAAVNAHIDVVKFLINAGADLNCCPIDKMTLLHFAAFYGWVDIVQKCVDKGSNLNMETVFGHTPLLLAAQNRQKSTLELLLNAGADVSCFDNETLYTNSSAWSKFMSKLISNGGNINDECTAYITLLHLACELGCLQILQRRLAKGDNINETYLSFTPLHIALNCRNFEIMEYLLKQNANCNIKNYFGQSPFSILVNKSSPNFKLLTLCIESNAYLNAADFNTIFEDSLLKRHILQDINLCSHAIVNQFNYRDLPELYELAKSCKNLSLSDIDIDKMRIVKTNQNTHEVTQYVKQEIDTKGYCNVLEARPITLKMLSISPSLCYLRHKMLSNQNTRSVLLKRKRRRI